VIAAYMVFVKNVAACAFFLNGLPVIPVATFWRSSERVQKSDGAVYGIDTEYKTLI
jgi:hypothetical protein